MLGEKGARHVESPLEAKTLGRSLKFGEFGGPEKKGNIVRSRFMRETFVAICLEACFFAADVHREKVIDPATNALSLQGSI